MNETTSTAYVASCLQRLLNGDTTAIDGLIDRCAGRLQRLTNKMFTDFPRLRRWETADDVFQNATVRLCRALRATVPESPQAFFRLATVQIRRELIDLARHHLGPEGAGAHHESLAPPSDAQSQTSQVTPHDPATETQNPSRVAEWTEFHQAVTGLPEPERDVFELTWYQGFSQDEIAELLGVDVRTVQRRWRAARVMLNDKLSAQPGSLE